MSWRGLMTSRQFSLSGLMFLITMAACVLSLGQFIGLPLAISITALPLGLLGQHLLHVRPARASIDCRGHDIARTFALMVCALGVAAGAWQSLSYAVPTLLSPFPLLVVVPAMFGLPMPCVAAAPVVVYALLHWDALRPKANEAIPLSSLAALGVGTLGSVFWLAGGWRYGLEYQGPRFTWGMIVINIGFVSVLWTLGIALRRSSSFRWRITFGTLLHYWLFWFAFPWLGELP